MLAIHLTDKYISDLKKKLPESPDEKLKKILKKYNIDKKNAEILTKHIDIAEFFESVVEKGKINAKFALPWITIELLRVLNYNKKELLEADISVEHFVKLLKLIREKKITELQAKQILNRFVPKSFDPSKEDEKIDNERELEKIVDRVIIKNGKAVSDYKAGDRNALNFLIGQIMKETNKRADFLIVRRILLKKLPV